jgi:hypothetical protein
MPVKVTPEEGRQGKTGQGVRYVLAFSLGGAALALLVIVAVFVL